MSKQGAERAVVISALVVFGMYFYRIATEGQSGQQGGVAQLLGIGAPANIGRFITGWGFAFLALAIITEAAPSLGGSLAILVATGDFLANGQDVFAQVTGQINKPAAAPQQAKPGSPQHNGAGHGLGNIGSNVRKGIG